MKSQVAHPQNCKDFGRRDGKQSKSLENTVQSTAAGSWNLSVIVLFVATYYAVSLSISVFNTQVLSKNRLNFPFPIFAAVIYDIIQFALAILILTAEWLQSSADSPLKTYKKLGWDRFWKTIVPCAIAAALDIALSNSSLRYISLSFYTMIKSSSPIFVLLFAFLLRLEKPSWAIGVIMLIIGSGTLLTVWNPAAFNAFGFVLVFSAAVMSGARWALTQIILEHQTKHRIIQEASQEDEQSKPASGPLAAILFLTPPIGMTLAILCEAFEGFWTIFTSVHFATIQAFLYTSSICLVGGLLTFTLILTEYKVVELTSVVTFSVAGIFKELGMVALSVVIFGDTLLPINYLGLVISVSGIAAYNFIKVQKKKTAARKRHGLGSRFAPTAHSDFYLAVPTVEPPLPPLVNPFLDDEDYFVELEESNFNNSTSIIVGRAKNEEEDTESGLLDPYHTRNGGALTSTFSKSAAASTSKLPSSVDIGDYMDKMKQQWSKFPALEHFPAKLGQLDYCEEKDDGMPYSQSATPLHQTNQRESGPQH